MTSGKSITATSVTSKFVAIGNDFAMIAQGKKDAQFEQTGRCVHGFRLLIFAGNVAADWEAMLLDRANSGCGIASCSQPRCRSVPPKGSSL